MAWLKIDMVLWKVREKDWSISSSSFVKFFSGVWDPNGVVTPTKAWDEYTNTTDWHKRYAQANNNSSRKEINYME